MKKIVSFVLMAVMLLALTACRQNDTPTTNAPPTTDAPPATMKALDMAQVYTGMTKGVQMPEMMRIEHDMMLDLYGIQAEHFLQAEVYICADSLRADEIWLIEAANAEALSQLKTLAENRLTAKDEESATYSPEQNAIVKKAYLQTYGNYLVMIVSPDVDAIAAAFQTEAGV